MNKNKVTLILNKILFILVGLMAFFFPTSIGGKILENSGYIYLYYGLSIFVIIWYIFNRSLNIKSIILFLFLICYMLLATIISISILDGKIATARIVYVILPTMLFIFDSKKTITYRFTLWVNEIITIVMIIWNCCLIFGVGIISNITTEYYAQFNWFTTNVFVENKSPIFTFGIYSYGAFFYALFFIFWIYVISRLKSASMTIPIRYYVYSLFFIVFQILMRGSTALMLAAVMLYFLLRLFGKKKSGIVLIPIFLVIGMLFISSQNYDWHRMIVGTSTNGFTSRYLSDWFSRNIDAVQKTIFGIGFTVPENMNLVYSDSGYFVLFTMGNIFLPVYLYSLLYRRLKKNFNKELCKDVFLVMMLFELSLPGLLYTKEIIYMIFFFMSIRSIDSEYLGWMTNQQIKFKQGLPLQLGENNE